MAKKLESIILTGASGIVGRNFLEAVKDDFLVYAIARRSQKEAGIAPHPNIKWIQVDIANWISLRWVMHNIKKNGGADYLLHLAAYYDFDYTDHPEYERTNVNGTRYMLEQAKILRVKRFIFAGSTAAAQFPPPGKTITEKTPPDADYAYARSKKKGEEMVKDFSRWFPCTIVRLAAVYTDWCEYGVLYTFLSTWLSKKWNSRFLGGRGESAVPYIHVADLNKILLAVVTQSDDLPRLDTYVAGPDGSTSHRELFETATRFYFGHKPRPFYIPQIPALVGTIARDLWGRLTGNRPFERPWMIKYLDCKLDLDTAYTRETLSWEPSPRYHILRRLLFLIEKMKHDPGRWRQKNEAALKRVASRPNLLLYEILAKHKDRLLDEICLALLGPEYREQFPNFRQMEQDNLEKNLAMFYQLLSASVRNNDRTIILENTRDLAFLRFKEGYDAEEMGGLITLFDRVIVKVLNDEPELKHWQTGIRDHISLTLQMAADEVEDAYEQYQKRQSAAKPREIAEIEAAIDRIDSFYIPPDPDAH